MRGSKTVVTVVVVLNGLIGLACLLVAWQFWQLKRRLASVTETLMSLQHTIYNIFHPAPGYIYKGQTGIAKLRRNYQQLQPQLQRLEQILGLISLGQTLWWRFAPTQRSQASGRMNTTDRLK